jgi:branched-chain amino acid transport system substrate-binding protein
MRPHFCGRFSAPASILLFATTIAGLSGCPGKEEAPKAAGASAPNTSVAPGEILVGEVGSMTGTEATFGQSTHKGIQLAVDEINAQGGIKGRKVRDLNIDDQGRPEEASSDVTELITREHVTAILGEVASSISIQMASIAQAQKVPMITPSSTNTKVTQIGDYIFRVCFIDPFQGQVMARFTKTDLGLGKVAIFRDIASDYSTGLADEFIKTYKSLGGEIVGDESYHKGDVDFRAQLTSLKSKAPQAIFIPGYYTDVGLIAKQARDLGMQLPLLGGDGWDSEKLYEIGGHALDGSYFSDHYSVDDTSPRIKAFVDAYKKKFSGEVPTSLAAMGYDAMMVLADALKRAPDSSGAALRDAIAATKNYEAVTGTISIDANRNALKPAVVIKVAPGGHYDFVKRVQP